jgi:hypothetical protein
MRGSKSRSRQDGFGAHTAVAAALGHRLKRACVLIDQLRSQKATTGGSVPLHPGFAQLAELTICVSTHALGRTTCQRLKTRDTQAKPCSSHATLAIGETIYTDRTMTRVDATACWRIRPPRTR